MDPKLINQQWTKFLQYQVNQLSTSNDQEAKSNENLINNPYYSKYADKLKNINLDRTSMNVEQQTNLSEEERKIKEKLIELECKLEKKSDANSIESNDQISKLNKSNKIKKLDDVIKLNLIEKLNGDEIKKIWFEHFKIKDGTIFAHLDSKNYDSIEINARKYPVFVFLLPVDKTQIEPEDQLNKNNYQFILVQFKDNRSFKSMQCCFTPLAFYHVHKENAPATLILNYYTDFKQTKQIVLMEGEYDNKIFNLLEAQCLANQIQIFYSNQDKEELLNEFNNNPQTFDYMRIIKEFEKSMQI